MSIVSLRGLFDVDVYAGFGFDLGSGRRPAVRSPRARVGAWISRRLAGSVKRASLLQRLSRDVAGHNLTAAMDFLGSLSQFEKKRVERPNQYRLDPRA